MTTRDRNSPNMLYQLEGLIKKVRVAETTRNEQQLQSWNDGKAK